jgi:hypothetical protein
LCFEAAGFSVHEGSIHDGESKDKYQQEKEVSRGDACTCRKKKTPEIERVPCVSIGS